ncbi:MAG: protein-disulfide reductase DsbD [Enterobacterales bacterium]|nr:protein-disulfide reductase DsbD [Enterobacterales bacterium]
MKKFIYFSLLLWITLLQSPIVSAEEAISSSLFGNDSEFLDVDEAFILSTDLLDDQIIVKVKIADNYYLYRSRFAFDAKGATLGKPYIPDGKKKHDQYLGDVEVYYHTIEISVPFVYQDSSDKSFDFIFEYQGCADAGLCYPPEEKTFEIRNAQIITPKAIGELLSSQSNPFASSSEAPARPLFATQAKETPAKQETKTSTFVPEQEKVSNLLANKSLFEIVITMVLIGIGLAFTPCVLPMVPILSSIIVGQGKKVTTGRSFALSLTYTQAMAIPFAGLGLLVGGASQIFGLDINSNSFQSPYFVIPAALMFLALSLSMFGFYELQLPAGMRNKLSNLSNDQKGGTLVGAAIMGALSALVVSPCVTVPVAGILLYIATTKDMLIGGVALYSLAIGMGIPLLLVGVGGGKLLPKAGGWMNAVKAAFGVAMIAMALYISKHLIPDMLNMTLWSLLLIVTATYMGALSVVQTNAAKFWKGIGLVIFAYGLLLLIGAGMGNHDLLKPLKGLSLSQGNASKASMQVDTSHFIRVKTIADVERQLMAAKASGQNVMFDFFAESCTACYEFEEKVFSHPMVIATLSNTILIQADVTANDEQDKALMKHFSVKGLPSILLFDKNGFEDHRLRAIGFEEAEVFVQRLEAAFTANL